VQTRRLGNSDMDITRVGLGAWAIGGAGWEWGWGAQDDAASVGAIHRALELGINWIDTAAVYGLGHSEEIVRRALSSWGGPRPYVFTKCGLRWNERRRIYQDLSGDSVRRECEDSLRRLGVEVIDLYQIHWPTGDLADVDAAWTALATLQQAGKVRWIGVCNFDASQLARVQSIAAVTSLQPPYSLLRREIEGETLPHCQAHDIGVIVYSPMASGLLTGTMTRERVAALPEDDWRRRDAQFTEPALTRNLELVERLRVVGARHRASAGEVAIAWTLHHPAVTAAIVGARSAAQIEGTVGAAGIALGADDVSLLER
jgi:aryl-alcohol dehydrogenase-like predicted oxidoreductase